MHQGILNFRKEKAPTLSRSAHQTERHIAVTRSVKSKIGVRLGGRITTPRRDPYTAPIIVMRTGQSKPQGGDSGKAATAPHLLVDGAAVEGTRYNAPAPRVLRPGTDQILREHASTSPSAFKPD